MKNLTQRLFLALAAFVAAQPTPAWADHRVTHGTRCETPTHFRASVAEADSVLGKIFAMVKGSGVMAPQFKSETAEGYRIGEATLLRTIRIHPTYTDEVFTIELDNDYEHHSVGQMGEDDEFLNLAAPQAAKVLSWLQESMPDRPEFPQFVPPFKPWVLNAAYPKPDQWDLVCPESIHSRHCYIKLGYLRVEHGGCY